MLPNVVTLLALCAGLTAIRLAYGGDFRDAAVAIIVAGIFDGMDGRVARLLDAASPFGAELDSLADFASFGIAPALLLYFWTMAQAKSVGWVLALLFGVCCALRLARFNVQLGAPGPGYAGRFFTGVPAPAGAGLVMIPLFLSFESHNVFFRSPVLNGFVLVAVSALMVSRIPTFSLKLVHLSRRHRLPILLAAAALAVSIAADPWATLLALGAFYVASIPVSIRLYRILQRQSARAEEGLPSPPATA
jgi:CDP-diacylglycerol--serine O-phosphatidyltransferase